MLHSPPPSDPTLFTEFSFGPGVHLQNYLQEDENQILKRFFHIYGPNVKSLSINNCVCSNDDLKAILHHGCPNLESLRFIAVITGRLFQKEDSASTSFLLPHLKCLQVNVRSSDLVRNTDFMVDLLNVAPNLEQISWIKLAHDEVSYDRNFQLDLEMAWSAQRSSSGLTIRDTIYDVAIHHSPLAIPKLSKIESNMRLSNASVLALRDRHFPLQYLDITLVRDVYVSSLTTLLESLSGTLKSLKIEFYPCFTEVWSPGTSSSYLSPAEKLNNKITQGTFHFPRMPNLQHLFLKRFYGSFRFLSEMICLETLSFCDLDIRDYLQQLHRDLSLVQNNSELSATLNLFQIFWDDTAITHHGMTFSPDDIHVLAKAFPNVSQIRGVKGISTKKRRHWFRRFEKLRILEELPTELGIGGLKGPNKDFDANECCYCCAHKKLQRLPGGPALSYWS